MKIAITGGTGFIGRPLHQRLCAAGHEVVAVSRRTGVDVQDPEALAHAFEGCTAVAHCAGVNRDTREQSLEQVHVVGTQRVIEAARRCGVRRLVLTSYLRARPDPRSRYHDTKWRAEELVRGSGLEWVVLRPGVVFGGGDHLLSHLRQGLRWMPAFPLVGLGPRPMRPLAVEDLVVVLEEALLRDLLVGEIWPVLGPEEIPVREVVRRVAEGLGLRRWIFAMPAWMHLPPAWCMERLMREPLAAVAQVRMLDESLVEVGDAQPTLPEALQPRLRLDLEQVRRGLSLPAS